MRFCLRKDFTSWHHDAKINHIKIITLQNNCHNIFTDIVHVAFNGCNEYLAPALALPRRRFISFDIGNQMSNGLLHHPG